MITNEGAEPLIILEYFKTIFLSIIMGPFQFANGKDEWHWHYYLAKVIMTRELLLEKILKSIMYVGVLDKVTDSVLIKYVSGIKQIRIEHIG